MKTKILNMGYSSNKGTRGKKNSNKDEEIFPLSTQMKIIEFDRVSEWFDTDSHKIFTRVLRSGDILEVRNARSSHFGIALRIAQPINQLKGKAKQEPDSLMVYHLIHSSKQRGQVGQFKLEEFWGADSRIRINNTANGYSLFGNTNPIRKTHVLQNAFTAHLSTTLKWQTCSEFIRWSCEPSPDPVHNVSLNSISSDGTNKS